MPKKVYTELDDATLNRLQQDFDGNLEAALSDRLHPEKKSRIPWAFIASSTVITAIACISVGGYFHSKNDRLAKQNAELREIMGYSQMSTTMAKQALIPKLMPHLAGKRDQAGKTGFYTFFIMNRIPEAKGFLDAAPQTLNVPRFVGKFDSTGGFKKDYSNGAHPIAMAITKQRYVAVNWLLDHLEDPATEISWDYEGHRKANGIHGALIYMLKQTPDDPELLALFNRCKQYLPQTAG